MNEAEITINGHKLSVGQSLTVRVALSSFAFELQQRGFMEGLGPIGPAYQDRVKELLIMIIETCE